MLAPERDLAMSKVDNSRSMPKCIFVNDPFEWDGDQPLRHPWSKTLIYEMHVRGFTIHPKSSVGHPGTYRGLTQKIPYLKTLGVTGVELMPVQEFNETSVTRKNPQRGQPPGNYWGYDPVIFSAPKASHSSSGSLGQQKIEFKETVQGNGPGLSQGWHRSDSGSGIQSHGRRKRTGAHTLFPRDG